MRIYEKLKDCLLTAVLILLTAMPAFAQQDANRVTGKVVDENDAPMAGVVVMVKGGKANAAAVTNAAGTFEIKAPAYATLTFSCLGYLPQEVKAGASNVVDVKMQSDAKNLEEVVVVGYGTQKKKDLTGGLSVIDDKTLKMVSTSNLMDRLVGQVAGLAITTSNAAPGSNQNLLIRGMNSLSATNDPLIILDGIPYSGSLADLDPNIIENMTVLKDASSVAIYGSRGSNGVILIQTKKGREGQMHVTYKGTFGIAEPMQRIEVMGPNEFIRLKQDICRLGTKQYTGEQLDPLAGYIISTSEKQNYAAGITHDWQDYVFRTVFTMDHQVSLQGGTDKTSYMAAASYLDNQGVVYNSNYKRITAFVSVEQTLNKWLKVGLTTQFINKDSGGVTPNIEHAVKQSPYGIYKDETGAYYEEPMEYSNLPNPMKNVNADNENTTRNVLVNGHIDIKLPVEGLSARSQFGYNYRSNFTGTYYGRNTSDGRKVNGKASVSNTHNTDWTWENVIKYDRNFGKHHLDVTGLFSMQEQVEKKSSQSGEGFVNDDSSFYRMDGAENNIKNSSSFSKETMVSYMFRVNYGFNSKYLLTLTGRADGASVFGANNKYGFFPSAAVAWNMSEENFIRDNASWIDLLKVRFSYGANGNNAITRYRTLDRLYATTGVKYVWGDGAQASNAAYLPSDGIGNPDLRWETTYSANLGIDFGFFNGRLGGTLNLYVANTHDLLMQRTVPIMNGYSKIYDNVGKTRNKGIELTINTENIRKKNFTWNTDISFFLNRDKIIELRGDGKDDINNKWFIGQPLSVYYDWNMVGIWQEGDEYTFTAEDGTVTNRQKGAVPGAARLEDVDGNGYIDSNDRKIIGSKLPSFTLSMGNRFAYKNFYFSFLLNGVFGKWMENNVANIGSWTFGSGNYIKGAKYWTPERPNAEYVSPGYVASFSHGYYKKLNYVQLKNITLGYRVADSFARKLGMSSIDVNLSVNNVHTFSNMRQMLNYDNTWFASFPTARSYMLGITLNF